MPLAPRNKWILPHGQGSPLETSESSSRASDPPGAIDLCLQGPEAPGMAGDIGVLKMVSHVEKYVEGVRKHHCLGQVALIYAEVYAKALSFSIYVYIYTHMYIFK